MTMSIAAAASAAIVCFPLGWFFSRLGRNARPATIRIEPFGQDATPWRPSRPEAAAAPHAHAIYGPGAFLVSAELGAETWVVSDGERWALSYEVDGTQRLAGWLDDEDVPLEIRLSALSSQPGWRERP
jgi:hypothetical protein